MGREEVPCRGALSARPPLCSSLDATERAIRTADKYVTQLTSLNRHVPPIVTFCVDGCNFAVSQSLLLKDPQSLLFVLTNEHYTGAPPHGRPAHAGEKRQRVKGPTSCHASDGKKSAIDIPGKDPQLFGMLLNVLRGYRNAVPEVCMDACREEATYYGLERSWCALYGQTPIYRFKSSTSGTKLNSEAVCAVASDYFSKGTHTIELLVAQCDRVGLGVVTEGADLEDRDALRTGLGCALYWNDGKISTNFGSFQMAETGKPFKSATVVQLTLDAEEGIVTWMLADEWRVGAVRLPDKRRFAFAVMATRTSQVNIVPAS